MNYAQVLMAFNAQVNDVDGNKYIAHREGWNGADQFIGLCTSWNGNLLTTSAEFEILPFTYIKTTQNKLVPWVPSQTDQLAEDWVINVVPATSHSAMPEEDIVPANDSDVLNKDESPENNQENNQDE